jgi:arabinose-5-phosphate isomerase
MALAPKPADDDLVALCRNAMLAEAEALRITADRVADDLAAALAVMQRVSGPIVVAGVGKSGHVARKIASTFSSIGRAAVFVHAAEASHGDMGIIRPDSAVLLLSNSGETGELSDMIHFCRQHSLPVIALTASATSTLGRAAEVTIAYGPVEEVCLIGLAPTTSTTVAMAIGDALAVGLTRMLGTHPEDFRRFHPGGKLGARLTQVSDIMHKGVALPRVRGTAPMAEVVVEMSTKSLGVAILTDAEDRILGIITDGDMRRRIDNLWDTLAEGVASKSPITIPPTTTADDAMLLMTDRKITSVLVADDGGHLLGLVHIHDCLRLGVGT